MFKTPFVLNWSRSKTTYAFAEGVSKVEETIRRMVVESFGVDKYIEEHLSSSFDSVRLMKYDGINNVNECDEESKFGAEFPHGSRSYDDSVLELRRRAGDPHQRWSSLDQL